VVPPSLSSVTDGTTNVFLSRFFSNHQLRTSGISIRHAGFGQVTVRAHIHPMTVALEPSGNVAFG
jgi:hypothetical protein